MLIKFFAFGEFLFPYGLAEYLFLTLLKPAKCRTKEKKRLLFIKPQNRETKPKATLSNEIVWRTQVQLVGLFQSSKSNISKHILEEGNNQLCGFSEQLPLIEGIIVQVTTI